MTNPHAIALREGPLVLWPILACVRFDAKADENHPHVERYGREVAAAVFAGAYSVPEERVTYVGFTVGAERHLAELEQRVPYPGILRLFVAKHSCAELKALRDLILEDEDEREILATLGLAFVTLGIDVPPGCVRLGVSPAPTEDQVCEVQRRYGKGVEVDHVIVTAA